MRRAVCFLPGLLLVGSMYWSTALGLGGLSLSWLLGSAEEEADRALELAPSVARGERDRRQRSCWLLAAEDPAAPGEIQRWKLSRCAADGGHGGASDAIPWDQLNDADREELPYGRTAF